MTCNYIKKDGLQCNARAINGKDTCYIHSISEEERKEIARKGGNGYKRNKLKNPLPEIEINGISDIPKFLIALINEVRSGKTDVRVSNAIGYISGHLIRAYDMAELEKRIEALELLQDNYNKTA